MLPCDIAGLWQGIQLLRSIGLMSFSKLTFSGSLLSQPVDKKQITAKKNILLIVYTFKCFFESFARTG